MLSIVIPARNEEDKIGNLLQSLERNDTDDFEVIVVDGDSSDRTVEIAEEYGAKVIQGPLRGTSAARNAGWEEAKGDYVYFLDADSELEEGAIDEFQKSVENTSADLLVPRHEIKVGTFVSNVVKEEISLNFERTYVGRVVEKVVGLLT